MKLSKELSKLTETKAFKIGGTIALILLIPLTVFIAQQQQDIRQRAQTVPLTPPVASTILSFTPTVVNIYPQILFTADIVLDSGIYNITGVDITVTYNKNVLTLESFSPSASLDTIAFTDINSTAGTLRYAAVDTTNKAPKGKITLGKMTFFAKAVGESSVNATNIQVTGSNLAGSIPVTVVPQTYTVVTPNPTATPTLIPTNTPTPTLVLPTNVPTAIPTITPVPPTSTPVPPTATPTPVTVAGDINKDGDVDILDFNIWLNEFKKFLQTTNADINNDGKIDLLDFNIWRTGFITANTPI